jgi:hypothetical protein
MLLVSVPDAGRVCKFLLGAAWGLQCAGRPDLLFTAPGEVPTAIEDEGLWRLSRTVWLDVIRNHLRLIGSRSVDGN